MRGQTNVEFKFASTGCCTGRRSSSFCWVFPPMAILDVCAYGWLHRHLSKHNKHKETSNAMTTLLTNSNTQRSGQEAEPTSRGAGVQVFPKLRAEGHAQAGHAFSRRWAPRPATAHAESELCPCAPTGLGAPHKALKTGLRTGVGRRGGAWATSVRINVPPARERVYCTCSLCPLECM